MRIDREGLTVEALAWRSDGRPVPVRHPGAAEPAVNARLMCPLEGRSRDAQPHALGTMGRNA